MSTDYTTLGGALDASTNPVGTTVPVSDVDGEAKSNTRLFVTNLNYQTSWHGLKDFVRQKVGEVDFVSVLTQHGRSRGMAVISFPTEEMTATALEVLNGEVLDGREIAVRREIPRAERPARPEGSEAGEYQQRPYAPRTRPSYARDTTQATAAGTGSAVTDTDATAQRSSPTERRVHDINSSIFVTGLPWTFTWMDLKELCAPYGQVAYADIYTEPGTRRSKGVGTVRFESPEAAHRAIEGINGSTVRNRVIYARMERPRA